MLPQQRVFGGICRETKYVFICSVPNRLSKTLMDCIENNVLPKTTIYSDCWPAYNALKDHPRYFHATVNHSENFCDPSTGVHTNTVECMWSEAKRKNKKMYGTNRQLIDSYMSEWLWQIYVKKTQT